MLSGGALGFTVGPVSLVRRIITPRGVDCRTFKFVAMSNAPRCDFLLFYNGNAGCVEPTGVAKRVY